MEATSAFVFFDDVSGHRMEIHFDPFSGLVQTIDLVAIALGHLEDFRLITKTGNSEFHFALIDPFVFWF
jgi:hypothetical protein